MNTDTDTVNKQIRMSIAAALHAYRASARGKLAHGVDWATMAELGALNRRDARRTVRLAIVERVRAIPGITRDIADIVIRKVFERVWRVDGDRTKKHTYPKNKDHTSKASALAAWYDCDTLERPRRDGAEPAPQTVRDRSALACRYVVRWDEVRKRTVGRFVPVKPHKRRNPPMHVDCECEVCRRAIARVAAARLRERVLAERLASARAPLTDVQRGMRVAFSPVRGWHAVPYLYRGAPVPASRFSAESPIKDILTKLSEYDRGSSAPRPVDFRPPARAKTSAPVALDTEPRPRGWRAPSLTPGKLTAADRAECLRLTARSEYVHAEGMHHERGKRVVFAPALALMIVRAIREAKRG